MPKPQITYNYTMEAAGDTVALDVFELYDFYNLLPDGGTTVYLLSNLTIDPAGTPKEGMAFTFNYGGLMAYDGGTITIFGRLLTATEAMYKYTITCTYTDSAWVVKLNFSDLSIIPGGYIQDTTVTNAKLAGSITLAKLLASTRGYLARAGASGIWEAFSAVTSGNLVMGNGTDVASVAMSGDATIAGTGVITIANNAIATAKILDDNVTVAKVSDDLKAEVVVCAASFETGELGAYKFRMPYPGSVTNFYVEVTRAMAATNDGTVILKDDAGTTMTVTTPVVIPASTVVATAYESAVTANNTFVAGDIITVFTAKVTAGGKVTVSLGILRS
jgi:hypothetical protein